MRALLAGTVLLVACRAAPAWEPIGGFELVGAAMESSELAPRELAERIAAAHARLATIHDYTAVLETRERIEDDLYPRRVMRLKLRHQPFSVAIETDAPANEAGQRVWYDASWNHGELLAETPGLLGSLVGRLSLDPEGDLALENRRHPLTDVGLARLVEEIEESIAPELAASGTSVRRSALEVAGRALTLVEALLPREPPEAPLCHRFGFDDQSGLLVYYGLAEVLADGPALVEEYLYRDVRLAVGLTDADFRPED